MYSNSLHIKARVQDKGGHRIYLTVDGIINPPARIAAICYTTY
jgi:hypothetical protein